MSTALMVIPKPITPGEWAACGSWVYSLDVPPKQSHTATGKYGKESWKFYGGELICESVANSADAQLIAAAPKLLAALEAILPIAEVLIKHNHSLHRQAVTALLLARGGYHDHTQKTYTAEEIIQACDMDLSKTA